MTTREKILAALVGLLIAGWALSGVWQRYQNALSTRRAALNAAREQLGEAQLADARGRDAMQRLAAWQERSLPADRQQAQALYRTWLLEQMQAAGLNGSIDLDANSPGADAYSTVGYTLRVKGELVATTRFLHAFYNSNQLHKITQLRFRPQEEGKVLDATIKVEGLLVKGTAREGELATGQNERLRLADAEAYQKSIVGRNVFVAHKPAENEQSNTTDEAAQAIVSFVSAGQRPQAWVTLGTSGKVLRLTVGDEIHVGDFHGEVAEISRKGMVITNEGSRQLVKVGKTLRDALPLEDGNDA